MKDRNMSDTSEESVKTGIKSRNKKGFREPTSLHVDPSLWQEVRVMAVLKGVSVTEYFEDALRKKIDADNREAGKGYRVGQGGMYIPPPPQQPPSVDVANKEKDRISKTIHQLGEKPPNRLTGVDADNKVGVKAIAREVEEQPQQEEEEENYLTRYEEDPKSASTLLNIHRGIEKDTVTSKKGEGVEFKLRMPDLEFPITRDNLIHYREELKKKYGTKFPLNYTLYSIKKLTSTIPTNKTYENKEALEGDLGRILREDKEIIRRFQRVIPSLKSLGFKIVTSEKPFDPGSVPKPKNLAKTLS